MQVIVPRAKGYEMSRRQVTGGAPGGDRQEPGALRKRTELAAAGSKGEITDPLQFPLTVLTTEFLQNVYNTLPLTKNINPYPALSQQPFLKPALLLPVCLSSQQSEQPACCNLWIVTKACKCSEIRGNSQTILCCSALQLPGHQGTINEPGRLTLDSWPLSAGKGTDAPEEREVRVFSPPNNRGGGCSHGHGGWMLRKKRNQPVPWTETGAAGMPGPPAHSLLWALSEWIRMPDTRELSPEGILQETYAPSPLIVFVQCLGQFISIHQGKSKQIVLSKNVFLDKNYMKWQIKVDTNI